MGLLRITEEYILDRDRTTEPALVKEMLIALILVVYDKTAQTVILKSIVLDYYDSKLGSDYN